MNTKAEQQTINLHHPLHTDTPATAVVLGHWMESARVIGYELQFPDGHRCQLKFSEIDELRSGIITENFRKLVNHIEDRGDFEGRKVEVESATAKYWLDGDEYLIKYNKKDGEPTKVSCLGQPGAMHPWDDKAPWSQVNCKGGSTT